jgi:nickel transport protein
MDGMKITTVKTNAKGEFLFAPKIKDTQYSFSVDTGDGHAAKTTVAIGSPALVGTGALRPPSLDQLRRSGAATSLKPPASQGQSHVAAPVEVSMDPALVDAISRQIAELKLQIDASQSRLRLCDILGGLGYIAGIFGLLAFLQARRMKVANEPSAKKPEGEKGKGEAGDASK